MRKLLFFVFFAIMLPETLSADDRVKIGDIKYDLVSKSKIAVVISFDNGYYKGDVVIPSSVEYYGNTYKVAKIGDGAFQNSTKLTSVQLPSSVTHIGFFAFSGCTSLTSVNISNNITHVGNYAFDGCMSLKSIAISNKETSIGVGTFRGCSSITSITLPAGLKEIRDEAFLGCSSLTAITIPKNVSVIGEKAFGGCTDLASISVSSDNNTYDSRNGCNAIIKKNSKTLVVGCKNTKVPSNVTSIGDNAFYNCSSLKNITIPNSITNIGDNAFLGCSWLYFVEIPSSVTSIGYNAFRGCARLKMVDVGEGVVSIGEFAFGACSELAYFTCRATAVPSTSSNAFNESQADHITLVVPTNSLDSYKAKTPWTSFGKKLTLSEANVIVMALCLRRDYGEANPTFPYIANSLLEGTPKLTCSATKTSPTGIYPIKVSKGSVSNSKVLLVDGTLTVTKVLATITPNNYTINVGDEIPTFEATYEGLKNNESGSVLNPTFSCSATNSETPGFYDITVKAASTNYDITTHKGILTIRPSYVTITITSAGVGTYCSDFDLDFSSVEGLKAYSIAAFNFETNKAVALKLSDAPANTGLFLKGAAGSYNIPVKNSRTYIENMLVGTTKPITLTQTDGEYTNYILSNSNGQVGFYRLSHDGNFPANRAYLQLPTWLVEQTSDSNFVGIEFDDEIDGIDTMSSDEQVESIYTINGIRVTKPGKGIYIVNGKKMLFK